MMVFSEMDNNLNNINLPLEYLSDRGHCLCGVRCRKLTKAVMHFRSLENAAHPPGVVSRA